MLNLIGTEVKTRFGWGAVLEQRQQRQSAAGDAMRTLAGIDTDTDTDTDTGGSDSSLTVVIGLEDFQGWSSAAPPRLITSLGDDVIL